MDLSVNSTHEPLPSLSSGKSTEIFRRFGKRLREYRLKADLTQTQLADRLGISVSYLSCIERGLRGISSKLLLRMHSVLGFSYREIMEDQPEAPLVSVANLVREHPLDYHSLITDLSGSSPYPHGDYTQALADLLKTCTPEQQKFCYQACRVYISCMNNTTAL